MDNLKTQTYNVLTKIMEQITKQKEEDEKNKLSNPENQIVPVTCKQLIDLYSHNLQTKEKLLLQLALNNDLASEMNTLEFRAKIENTLAQFNMQNNQFNIPQSQLPKALVNVEKNNGSNPNQNLNPITKTKKSNQPRKTQPTVQSHPEYFRIDHQVCHKLFQHYRLMPLGIPKHGTLNFQQNQHHKNSLNYHKILEIMKDAKIQLQINQKLMILRSIKKFCFNQNFISIEEFIKVFKVIVHGLGIKEQVFEEFVKRKQFQKDSPQSKNNNNKGSQQKRRNIRFKTDMHEQRSVIINSVTKNIQHSIQQNKKSVPQKKMLSNKKFPLHQGSPTYLVKAMQHQKVSKITWQSLFNMRETSMNSFIVVPSFVKNVNVDEL